MIQNGLMIRCDLGHRTTEKKELWNSWVTYFYGKIPSSKPFCRVSSVSPMCFVGMLFPLSFFFHRKKTSITLQRLWTRDCAMETLKRMKHLLTISTFKLSELVMLSVKWVWVCVYCFEFSPVYDLCVCALKNPVARSDTLYTRSDRNGEKMYRSSCLKKAKLV